MLEVNKSICHRVVDGDTYEGDLIIPVPTLSADLVLKKQKFRLYGVNTPERGKPLYFEATEFTAQQIEGKEFSVLVHGKDSFGRWLVVVLLDGESLGDMLLKEELAVVYQK